MLELAVHYGLKLLSYQNSSDAYNVQGGHLSCACLAQPVQQSWKSCAEGSIVALHLRDHEQKKYCRGVVGSLV